MADVQRIKITTPLQYIYDEVHSRTYYEGESLKRKDIDYVSLQSGADDEAQLHDFVGTALNDLQANLIKRVKECDVDIDDDENIVWELTPYQRVPESDALRSSKVLGKAMQDYIVNKCVTEWKRVVYPSLVDTNESQEDMLMYKVQRAVGMISGIVRRRATDLCGI